MRALTIVDRAPEDGDALRFNAEPDDQPFDSRSRWEYFSRADSGPVVMGGAS